MANSGFMMANFGRFNSVAHPRLVSVLSCVMTQLEEDSLPAADIVSTTPIGIVCCGLALLLKKSQKIPIIL